MSLIKRFEDKFIPEPMSGCWLWTGAQHRQGYGHINIDGTITLAHRISWTLYRGSLDPQICVCHTCDNTSCVNPDHLFLGTYKDNIIDCIRKGRANRPRRFGSKNNNAILNETQVRRILRDRRSIPIIAHEYEVAKSTIGMIKRGWNWRNLFDEWTQELVKIR